MQQEEFQTQGFRVRGHGFRDLRPGLGSVERGWFGTGAVLRVVLEVELIAASNRFGI